MMRVAHWILPAMLPSLALAAPAPAGGAYGLNEAYRAARARTETLARLTESIEQAEARRAQAVGGVLPSLSLNGAYNWYNVPAGSSAASTTSYARITGSQAIFRGFREYAGIRLVNRQLEASRFSARAAEIELYQSVGEAFFAVTSAEQDLRNLQRLLELSIKRVDEIRGRVKIGRSRASDLYSADSQVATAQAQVQAAEVALEQARDRFAEATGLDRGTRLNPAFPLPSRLEPLATLLARLEDRPDLRAQSALVSAAEESSSVAWGAHLPSIDLGGNYYLSRTSGSVSASAASKWDLTLSASLPIFQGGVIQGEAREAASRERDAVLARSSARRAAEREIRSYYQATEGGLLQVEFLRKAAESAEKNYEALSRDYRLGLITHLDVLSSLNTYVSQKRQYDQAQANVKLAWINLQAATGRAPEGTEP